MIPNKEIIERVRQLFLKNYEANPQLYHENDIKNIRENDWPIERFVLVNSNEEKSLQAVIKAMQWRKSFGIHNFNDQYFPYEIYKINFIHRHYRDKEGRPIFWLNGRNMYKCGEFDNLLFQYFAYKIEEIDRQTSHQGWVYVSDMSGCGFANVNTDFSNFHIEILQNYYPRSMKYLIGVEMPFLLNAPSKIILAFANEELKSTMKFVKKEELTTYLDRNMIPDHLGGTNAKLCTEIPVGVKRLDQMPHLGFSDKQIEKICSTYKCLK